MPLFTFQCSKCETVSEILVRGEEAPACPECGSKKLVKQASAFAPMAAAVKHSPAGCGSCQNSGGCPFNS